MTHRTRRLLGAVLAAMAALSLSAGVAAHAYPLADFTLIHPWADATAADAVDAPVYFTIDNASGSDRLIRGHSPIADSVELRPGDDRAAPALASMTVGSPDAMAFVAGRPHLLLRGLKAGLQWGRSYPLTLFFEKAGPVSVMVSIGAH